MRDLLPIWPELDDVVHLVELADENFRRWLDDHLPLDWTPERPAPSDLTFAECCGALTALDSLANSAVDQLSTEHELGGWRRAARKFADCERQADRWRAARRSLAVSAASRVRDGGYLDEFVADVVWPLLWRLWLPRVWRDGWADSQASPNRAWREPGPEDPQPAEIAGWVSAHERDPLGALVEALRAEGRHAFPSAPAAADYVQAAVALYDPPLGASVVFAPADAGRPGKDRPLGHVTTVLILGQRTAATREFDQLREQSLTPALSAARSLVGRELNVDDRSCGVSVGDLPGGVAPLQDGMDPHGSGIRGRSGGISLAAALVAASMGRQPRPAVLATGAIDERGRLLSLGASYNSDVCAQLHAKGRMIAASGAEAILRVIVADEKDALHLRRGIREIAHGDTGAEVVVLHNLGEAIELMTDPVTVSA